MLCETEKILPLYETRYLLKFNIQRHVSDVKCIASPNHTRIYKTTRHISNKNKN